MVTSSRRIYLDYAASTPVAPEVLRTMQPYFSGKFGNPGSLHSFGQEALTAVDRSRAAIAAALGVGFREVLFTGSATEANNLALRGTVRAAVKGRVRSAPPRIIISAIEHESILETAKDMEREGVEVIRIPVDRNGVVRLSALAAALNENTSLVSIMYANNETGTVQPIAKIAKMVRESSTLLHVDAVQAFQFLDCRPAIIGADLITFSAHKIYGPKGIGALYIGPRAKGHAKSLRPTITGGGQEFGFRSGTENVPLIAGFAAAVEYIEKDKEKHSRRVAVLKEQLLRGIKKIHPRAQLNGAANGLPHIVNIWLPGLKAEDMLIRLDLAGIAVSAGSACTARSSQPSHVLRAMGLPEARVKESIRISLGRPTTQSEIARFLKILDGVRAI